MPTHDKAAPGGGVLFPPSQAGFLAMSLRKLFQDPDDILAGLVREGDTVVDLGCGPGFFTLPLARMVGPSGRVIAADIQEGMLERLRERAKRAGLWGRIRAARCTGGSVLWEGEADFVLGFYMMHETRDVAGFMACVREILKDGGRFFLAEPKLHVSRAKYRRTVDLARRAGLEVVAEPRLFFTRATLFGRAFL